MEFFLRKLDSNNLISSNYEYRNFFSLPKVKAKGQSNSFIKNTAEKGHNLLKSVAGPLKVFGNIFSSTDLEFSEKIKSLETGRTEHRVMLSRVVRIIENMEAIRQNAELRSAGLELDFRELRSSDLAADLLLFEAKKNSLENLSRIFFENLAENTLFLMREIKRDLAHVIEKESEYLEKIKRMGFRTSGSETWKDIQADGLKRECEVLLGEISVFVKGVEGNLESAVFEFKDAYLGIEVWGFFKKRN